MTERRASTIFVSSALRAPGFVDVYTRRNEIADQFAHHILVTGFLGNRPGPRPWHRHRLPREGASFSAAQSPTSLLRRAWMRNIISSRAMRELRFFRAFTRSVKSCHGRFLVDSVGDTVPARAVQSLIRTKPLPIDGGVAPSDSGERGMVEEGQQTRRASPRAARSPRPAGASGPLRRARRVGIACGTDRYRTRSGPETAWSRSGFQRSTVTGWVRATSSRRSITSCGSATQ